MSKRLMALSVPLCLFLVGCSKPLFENLSERQANEVVAALLSSNIDASKAREGKQGYVVRVDKADMSDAIELVQSRNLPSRERVEISSAFPADALVSTPESERARLFSAIEQRLEQSLAVFDNVVLARVHLSYDTRRSNPRRDEDVPMHVSAVLATRGEVDAEGLIQRVKRFLRNSFARVDYDNVSVVLVSAPSTPIVEVTKRPFPIGAVVSVAFGAMAAAAALCLLVWRLASRGRRSSLPVLRRNNEPPSAEK